MLGIERIYQRESSWKCLTNDIKKGFLRGVMIELLSEGVGVNWGQMETEACAKALGWAGKHVAFERVKKAVVVQ